MAKIFNINSPIRDFIPSGDIEFVSLGQHRIIGQIDILNNGELVLEDNASLVLED